jgi:hypothetical protein
VTPRKILVDTNLLLLFVVGSTSQEWIGRHKRLGAFDVRDYVILARIVGAAEKIVVTPNILTETSNLLGSPKNPDDQALFGLLAQIVKSADILEEVYVPSARAAETRQFPYLGLTDAGILTLKEQNTVVLTLDQRLASECMNMGLSVLPFDPVGVEV